MFSPIYASFAVNPTLVSYEAEADFSVYVNGTFLSATFSELSQSIGAYSLIYIDEDSCPLNITLDSNTFVNNWISQDTINFSGYYSQYS